MECQLFKSGHKIQYRYKAFIVIHSVDLSVAKEYAQIQGSSDKCLPVVRIDSLKFITFKIFFFELHTAAGVRADF